MKRWSLITLLLCMTLVFNQSGFLAKGSRGQGTGNGSALSQNSHGNGQGSVDRDFGKDRAAEVGHGKKKGLHKDHHSGAHKNSNDTVKKPHHDKN